MKKRIVLTSGFGEWYPSGVKRLRESFASFDQKGIHLLAMTDVPSHIADHARASHSFKIRMLNEARASGYETALWCDASIIVQTSLLPLFEDVERRGAYLMADGHNHGEYVSDAAIEALQRASKDPHRPLAWHGRDYNRKVALLGDVPNLWTCVVGLSFRSDVGCLFLSSWSWMAMQHPEAFNGPDDNRERLTSLLKRVRGHRHDQTVAEFVAWRLGVEPVPMEEAACTSNYAIAESKPLFAKGGVS